MNDSASPDAVWARMVTLIEGGTYSIAPQAVRAALAVIADRDTTIAALQAQLDSYQGRMVYFCLDRHLGDVAESIKDAEPGSILRATDTGRELLLERGQMWRERS